MTGKIIERKAFGNISIAMQEGLDKPFAVSYAKDGVCTSWVEFENGEDAYEDYWARVDYEELMQGK